MTLTTMIDMSVDAGYKFRYNKVVNKYRQRTILVGPQTWQTLTVKPSSLTLTDANAIHINLSSGNDGTGDGTAALPYLTMTTGMANVTSAKQYVYVTADVASIQVVGDYPYPTTYDANFQGCFALSGKTIQWTARALGYTPADDNSIFMDKTGDDGNAGTQAAPVLTLTGTTGAISKCDATHQAVVIMDSGAYDESAFTFTGNFLGLYAASGMAPTITINQNVSSTTYSPFTIASVEVDDAVTAEGNFLVKLNDDSMCHVWRVGTTGYYTMYRNNDYRYKAETQFSTVGVVAEVIYAVIVLPISNNVVIIFRKADDSLYYYIIDKAGTEVKALTQITTGTVVAASAAAFSDDTFVIAWCDSALSYGYYFATFNSAGTAVVTATYIGAGNHPALVASIEVLVQDNNNFVVHYLSPLSIIRVEYTQDGVSYSKLTDYGTYYVGNFGRGNCIAFSDGSTLIFSSYVQYSMYHLCDRDGIVKKQGVLFTSDSASAVYGNVSMRKIGNDNIAVIASNYTGSNIYLLIYDKNMNLLRSQQQVLANKSATISAIVNSQGDIIFSYIDTATSDLFYARVSNYYFVGCSVQSAATINGITFDCENQDYMKYLFVGASKLTRKYCEIKNMASTYFDEYTNLDQQGVSLLTGALERQYDYIHDVVNGDNVTNAAAIVFFSIFLNCTGIDFYCSGTAASLLDIGYYRNAAVNCAGGCYLVGNGGTNEIVANSIFYNVSGYDVSMATAALVGCCVLTGESNNITELSAYPNITLNPLFLNAGALGSSLANLDLMDTAMGDAFTSPCFGAGFDIYFTDEDIGPYQTLRIGPADSYSTFTVTAKPRTKISRDIKFAGNSKLQLSDGSYASGVDGASEVITFQHDNKNAITRAEFESWLTMMLAGKQDAGFCAAPTTSPNTYVDVILFFDDTPAYAPVYSLDQTYKASIKFSFAYKLTV